MQRLASVSFELLVQENQSQNQGCVEKAGFSDLEVAVLGRGITKVASESILITWVARDHLPEFISLGYA